MAAYQRSTSRNQNRITISYLKEKDIPTSNKETLAFKTTKYKNK